MTADELQIKESINGFYGADQETPNVTRIEEMYELITEQFYDEIQPLTAKRPYMVAPGNHDSNCEHQHQIKGTREADGYRRQRYVLSDFERVLFSEAYADITLGGATDTT
jgi:hypothetical protein